MLIIILDSTSLRFPRSNFTISSSYRIDWLRGYRGGAFPTTAIAAEENCLLVEAKCIAVCGDFCVAPCVEGAILSGLSAAKRLCNLLI